MAGKRNSNRNDPAEDSFAGKLGRYIEMSGMSVQKLSAVTGLGRTAIHHTLAGKLVPAKSFIDRLCASLPMTPEQKKELIDQYAREKAGDAVFYNRSRIKHIIESLPQYRISDCISTIALENVDISHDSVRIASGIMNVNIFMRELLLRELQADSPAIIAAIPFDSLFFEMLMQIFSSSEKKVRLEHYFAMNTCAEGVKNTNMDILQGALKTAMCAPVEYFPYYHYISEQENNIITPYPYYAVSTEFSLLISADLTSAVLISSQKLREELIRHSEGIKSHSSLIIMQVGQSEIFETFSNTAQYFYSSIEYQPCLTSYITEDILLKRLGDIPDKEEILAAVRERFFSGKKPQARYFRNYFSKEGLISFSKTGQMTNMPGSLLLPMSREERIYFLEAMKAEAGSFVMLTKDFAIPSFMQAICLTTGKVIISCLTEEKNFCCMLTEPGLCGAFEDIMDNLSDMGLTEGVGILTAVIDCCIEMLKNTDEEIISDEFEIDA